MALFDSEENYEKYLKELGVKPNSPYDTITKSSGGFLGIGKSKNIYTISMAASKVFDEDQYESTRTKLIIDKAKNDLSTKDYIYGFSKVGDLQFAKYYNAGQNYYKDYLPTALFTSLGIPKELIKNIIEKEINNSINIEESAFSILSDEDWCKYQLQETIGYSISNGYVTINDKYYEYTSNSFNDSNNIYNVVLTTIKELTKETNKLTTITITNKDTTTDIKTTSVLFEYKFFKRDNGLLLDIKTENISDVVEEVPIGSVLPSNTYEFISSEDIDISVESITKTVPSYKTDTKYYKIYYQNLSDNKMYLWIYDITTNKYPELQNPIKTSINTEMYPVAIVRNRFNNVSGERKEKTEELLNSIGVGIDSLFKSVEDSGNADKIQDCFLLFGVSPSETDNMVSKVLYETVDYIYDTLGEQTNNSYSLASEENPYFSNVLWTNTNTEIKKEKIMSVDECTHKNEIKFIYNNLYVTSVYLPEESTGRTKKFLIKYFDEDITEDGVVLESVITKTQKIYFYDYAYKEGMTTKIQVYSYVETSTDPDKPDKYIKVYVDVPLYTDNKEHISNKYEKNSKPSTNLIVTKQIDKEHTKTYTLQDFIGNFTIYHQKGTSVIGLNGANKELVIPLLLPVIQRLTIIEKTKLLDNVIYLQYYAFDHQHLKWYQTGAFGALLKIISVCIIVIVSIFTAGSGTTPTIELTAILWSLLETVVIAVGLSLALKLIISSVDNNFLKIVLSATAIIIATYIGGGFEGFEFLDAVQLVNSSIDSFNIYIDDKSEILQDKIEAFNNEYTSRLEQYTDMINELNEGLSVTDIVDLSIINSDYVTNPLSFDVSNYYYLALDSYKDYDLLFMLPTTSVDNFVDNKFNLIGD